MRLTAQEKKAAIISDLAAVRSQIVEIAGSLPSDKQDQVFLGTWSIKELLAHLIGWDFTNIAAIQAVRSGKLPDFYAYRDKDWSSYNAMLVSQYRQEDYRELLSAVKDSHQQLISFLETIPAGELDRDWGVRFKGYKVTIARLLEAEAGDEKIHLEQIRSFATT
ncbi:MAG: DinB family protein [Chloroflexi bacterium]|nr:DinB family protein [Chloroflexota bacterium]